MEILRRFLATRELGEPTGLPLYTYRCSRREFEELAAVLRDRLSSAPPHRDPGPTTSQAFCLWAAEWWRRHHQGGTWRWEDLLRELACDNYLAPGTPGYPRLCRMVADGLKSWHRELLRSAHGRAFLVTLACEGGLPLRLVNREQASLRRFFKALLEEFRIFGRSGMPAQRLAERVAQRLPKSLRHDVVYELSGRLIAQIWQLQEEVGESRTPLRDLDRIRPGWRDELPLQVSDDVARTLLNSLLLDAATVAKGRIGRIRWVRSLVGQNSAWTLVGELDLPATLERDDFAAIFRLAENATLPSRGDLCLREEGANPQTVALISERVDGDGERFLALDHTSRASKPVRGPAAAMARSLVARDGANLYRSDSFSGAARLSELPWVFERETDGQDEAQLGFVGEGSVRLRGHEAFVAVPDEASVESGQGSVVLVAGLVEDFGRTLYRVSGRVVVEDSEGGRSVIQTGVDRGASASEYRLQGRRRLLGRDGHEVFVGIPEILERRSDGVILSVPRSVLIWKSNHPEAEWCPFTDTCYGDGRVRYVVNGEVRFSSALKMVPASVELRYHPARDPGQGVIEFVDFGVDSLFVVGPSEVRARVEREDAIDHVHLQLSAGGEPPPSVQVCLQWGKIRELQISLPFPSLGTGFRDPAGRILPADANVSIGAIGGINAVALVPQHECSFSVEGHYRGDDAASMAAHRTWFREQMHEISRGHFELDLGSLKTQVEPRLNLSDDVAGHVRLEIHSNQVAALPRCPLRVSRYDLHLELAPNGRHVRLAPEHWDRLAPDEIAELRVEALPLLAPDHAPVPLVSDDDVLWELPRVEVARGPWMIVGWHGDWCRVRPLVWHPASGTGASLDVPNDAQAFADVYRFRDPGKQEAALAEVMGRLARNPAHADWVVIDNLVQWTKHLPPVTFDILRALVDAPVAVALAALRIGSADDLRLLFRELETLPFRWWLVPRSAWIESAESLVRGLETEFAAMGDAASDLGVDELIRDYYRTAANRVVQEMPWLEPVFGFAEGRLFGTPLSHTVTAVVRPEMQKLFLEQRRQTLADSSIPAVDLRMLPRLDCMDELPRKFRDLLGGDQLWLQLERRYRQPGRSEVANAPAAAALCALQGERMSRLHMHELWNVHDLDPSWFKETFRLTYLYALGVQRANRIRAHV